jgi:murein DD-endopeptidase MepM/ murein hydrolase activator NlpD
VSDAQRRPEPLKGYGNIYTPHAGSMIIQVQREGGLANRTIILSPRRVRVLRFLMSRTGLAIAAVLTGSWIYFAVQSLRIPILTHRIATMERDARRLDTLQLALVELQKRYEQVQGMLSASGSLPRTMLPGATVATDTTGLTTPSQWPLAAGQGFVTRGSGGESPYNGPHPGVDVAVPVGTEVRAAGGGLVVEVGESDQYGRFLRLVHADGYETLYAHASRILVQRGQRVAAGQLIALPGNTGRSTAPHLHFEVRRAGQAVDPLQLLKQGQ